MHGTTTPDRARALSRRTVLRGAGAAGALVWTAPVVQVVAMTPASAATPSDDGGGPPPPPPPQEFRASTSGSSQSFTGGGQVGPGARSERAEDGTQTRTALLEPLPPGLPVSFVVGASESSSTVDRASRSAHSSSRTALARFSVTVPVVSALGTVSQLVVEVTGLQSSASALVSGTGTATATAASSVATVRLGALPAVEIGTEPRTIEVPGTGVRLVLNERADSGARASAVALRVEGLPAPLGTLVVAHSTADASLVR